ncbi:MAG: hypothetical protein LUD68_10430 [Rikenellaceae bacterium]|nr:hypothetical protein [Rikenellaceae bacterium]
MGKKYIDDKHFLEQYLRVIELQNGDRKVLLTPDYQGRVMTSTADGDQGYSYGWLNYQLIESGRFLPHCNNFGGEDRFWLGPEGGQFSIFFPQGSDFGFEDWQAPAVIDTQAWETVSASAEKAIFFKETLLKNYADTELKCRLDREVSLLDEQSLQAELGIQLPEDLPSVAFRSVNKLTNAGDFSWNRQTGMLSVWILGQFITSDRNTIIITLKPCAAARINDSYFGKIGDDRLRISDHVLYFKGDGGKRGKIGTPPEMTVPVCGAYDAENGTLTIVKFSFDPSPRDYVNSMWEHQQEPFKGDVINSYNDGPLEDGSLMGPFYEIESSSAASALAPGETLTHTHTTVHFKGAFDPLNTLSKALLGVDLSEVPAF